jgi:hypothetical protein
MTKFLPTRTYSFFEIAQRQDGECRRQSLGASRVINIRPNRVHAIEYKNDRPLYAGGVDSRLAIQIAQSNHMARRAVTWPTWLK